MIASDFPIPRLPQTRWLVPMALSFVYWLAFVLVLEPGNLLRAATEGYALALDHEAQRMAGAALLGSLATPALLTLTQRFPLIGGTGWRHAAIHLAGNTIIALMLVLASCLLAAWVFENRWLPGGREVLSQLTSNWTLLIFATSAFTLIAHLRPLRARIAQPPLTTETPKAATQLPIKMGGRLRVVDLTNVAWIETQGNYVALHIGSQTQLLRRTLTDLETELDPQRFVRIHRRTIVAIDRIREMKPLTNGDALVLLIDGQELRASRRYRETLRERWRAM